MQWLLYGANGYTGELTAREAARRGMKPVLGGRSAAVEALARELGLEARVFGLDAIDLRGIDLVLHCAGPFSATSKPMVDACLSAGAHYLDITGEIAVFESIFRRDSEAKSRGVTLLPGVGFDVVPTDALASMLAHKLPDAEELWLAFYSRRGGMSRGTMRTALQGAGHGGAIRRDGKIVDVPMLFDVRTIPFDCGERMAMTIPWGDVSTAWRTTGIPNIRVYQASSPGAIRNLRMLLPLLPLLRNPRINKVAQKIVIRRDGPTAAERATARMHLWGRIAKGTTEVTMTMQVPEGYTFTVLSSLAAVERMVRGAAKPGAFTPSQMFGAELLLSIDGVRLIS